MRISDKAILEQCIEGNTSAWETFLKKYSRVIYSSIYRVFKKYSHSIKEEDAKDLYHHILVSLLENDYKKLKQYQGINECSFATWLGVVSVRMTINFIKKEGRKDKSFLPMDKRLQAIGDDGNFSGQVGNKEMFDQIRKIVVEDLKPREQLFLRLFFEKGLAFEEVARLIDMTPNSAYVLKNRVLKKIKNIYCKKYLSPLSK